MLIYWATTRSSARPATSRPSDHAPQTSHDAPPHAMEHPLAAAAAEQNLTPNSRITQSALSKPTTASVRRCCGRRPRQPVQPRHGKEPGKRACRAIATGNDIRSGQRSDVDRRLRSRAKLKAASRGSSRRASRMRRKASGNSIRPDASTAGYFGGFQARPTLDVASGRD